jgi:tRNA/rRNA methyltransferase protein
MKKITSAQNPLVKKLVQLSEKQSFRNKQKMTIIEGAHLTAEWLKRFGVPDFCVISSSSKRSEEVEGIIQKCEELNTEIIELEAKIYSKISPVIEGVGILFVVKIPENQCVDFCEDVIILDRIQDPGNFGTILRSAVGFGVKQIICSKGTVSAWSPKVLRSGMGAHFKLQILENQDLNEVILKVETPIFATSLQAEKSIYDENFTTKTAWIFGNEGAGVSLELLSKVKNQVIIPQVGQIESLNVAMAATVCLAEQARQRLKA